MKKIRIPQIYRLSIRYPKTVLLFVTLLTILSLRLASRLEVESDLAALLPKKTDSVQSLEFLKQSLGGFSYLFVTIESPNISLSSEFAERFVSLMEQHPSVAYVDFHHPIDFFKKRFWLYLDISDLKEIEQRVTRALVLEKEGFSSTFSNMMDFANAEERPNLNFDDILAKYKKRAGMNVEEVSTDNEGNLLVLRVKVKEDAENMAASRKFVSEIRQREETLKADPRFQSIRVGYTGSYETKIEALDFIKREMMQVSFIVGVILLVILLICFRNLWSALLVGLPLVISLAWTGALVYALLGHLNVMTGFGAAILSGLGSDYGIYLMTRYQQEREAGFDFNTACDKAFALTGKATYGSMITTIGSFLALLFSRFGVFKEFGIVGAAGILAVYIAIMLIIPAVLALRKNSFFSHAPKKVRPSGGKLFNQLFMPRRPWLWLSLILILCFAAAWTLPTQTHIIFDAAQVDNRELPGNKLYTRVTKVLGENLNPTVLIVSGKAAEEKIVSSLETSLKTPGRSTAAFSDVLGLTSFVPPNQEMKKVLLLRIKGQIQKLHLVVRDYRKFLLETLDQSIQAPLIDHNNLPKEIRRVFLAPNNQDIYAVYLYPAHTIDRGIESQVSLYRKYIESLKQETSVNFVAADGDFVIADTVNLVRQEAPRGLFLILSFLFLVLLFICKPLSRSLLIMSQLIIGLVLSCGLFWIFHIPLNILNIAAISIVLGTGIDSFIHFNQRYDEKTDMEDTIRNKVPAILVANATSIVGLGGLILTSIGGIRSIGWLSVVGLTVITLLAVFIFPRCLVLIPKSDLKRFP